MCLCHPRWILDEQLEDSDQASGLFFFCLRKNFISIFFFRNSLLNKSQPSHYWFGKNDKHKFGGEEEAILNAMDFHMLSLKPGSLTHSEFVKN